MNALDETTSGLSARTRAALASQPRAPEPAPRVASAERCAYDGGCDRPRGSVTPGKTPADLVEFCVHHRATMRERQRIRAQRAAAVGRPVAEMVAPEPVVTHNQAATRWARHASLVAAVGGLDAADEILSLSIDVVKR